MTEPCCYIHPNKPASNCCRDCCKMVCEPCVRVGNNNKIYCLTCFELGQKRRRVLYVSGVVFLSVAIVIGVLLARSFRNPLSHSIYSDAYYQLHKLLQADPCNRPAAEELAVSLSRAKEYRESALLAERFITQCGDVVDLQRVIYYDYFNLAEFDKAIVAISGLVEKYPNYKYYWAWRARAYVERGDLQAALSDFQKALDLSPNLTDVPFEMANIYERMGQYCDAIFLLEHFRFYYHTPRDMIGTQKKITALYARPECADVKSKVQAYLKTLPPLKSENHDAAKEGKTPLDLTPTLQPSEYTPSPSKHIESNKKNSAQRRIPGFTVHF